MITAEKIIDNTTYPPNYADGKNTIKFKFNFNDDKKVLTEITEKFGTYASLIHYKIVDQCKVLTNLLFSYNITPTADTFKEIIITYNKQAILVFINTNENPTNNIKSVSLDNMINYNLSNTISYIKKNISYIKQNAGKIVKYPIVALIGISIGMTIAKYRNRCKCGQTCSKCLACNRVRN